MRPEEKKTKFEEHLLAVADITLNVGAKLDLKNDALQSCFATILISADRHGVFLSPTEQVGPIGSRPKQSSKAPTSTSLAVADRGLSTEEIDAELAKVGTDSNGGGDDSDIDPDPTPEKAEAANKKALLGGINDAIELLNKIGHQPAVTVGGLNAYIKKRFNGKTLDALDLEELEALTKYMCQQIEKQKAKNAEKKNEEKAGF